MKLIATCGLPRSGKDTFGDYLCEKHYFQKLSFAGPLKKASAILLGMSEWHMSNGDREAILPNWGFSVRHFLRYMGTEVARQFDPDFWVKRFEIEYDQALYTHPMRGIVVTDCRFPNEAAWVKKHGGVMVHITRPGIEGSNHASDAGLPIEVGDVTLVNDGTLSQFHDKIKYLLQTKQI